MTRLTKAQRRLLECIVCRDLRASLRTASNSIIYYDVRTMHIFRASTVEALATAGLIQSRSPLFPEWEITEAGRKALFRRDE